MTDEIGKAKKALNNVIKKARVHLYKPIQIAEILYRDRIHNDISINELESYRNPSKKWRDAICNKFLGRVSTSSARYQDDVFNENATPPHILNLLAQENRRTNGAIEAYIYQRVQNKFSQLSNALMYCNTHNQASFQLSEFLALFWNDAGLRRSIDKVYEIVVYALFSALLESLELMVEVSINPEQHHILAEFADFTERVIKLTPERTSFKSRAKIYRVGVTNAADRGLDMWANFGLAIQIKHLSLDEGLAENIVHSITADRIVIVCKEAEQKIIVSLLTQIGWKSRIQSIVTENDLITWYEKALRGQYHSLTAIHVLETLSHEIQVEFPVTENLEFQKFFVERGYRDLDILAYFD
ncbi:MAG: hypothetical protein RIS84_258 [Pseudomonadota bacterium]|jgi:type II restriction enzyme